MDLDTRFQSVIQSAQASAERRAREAEQARLRALPPAELRKEARAAWEPLRDAIFTATDQWNSELTKFGFKVAVLVEERTDGGQILEILKIQVKRPDGALGLPLQLTPVANDPGHISYSGPRGNVLNGAQGTIPLFDATAGQVLDIVLRHVEQQVK